MGFIRLRVELRAIRAELEKLHEAIKEHSETIHATRERERDEKSIPNPVHAVVSYDDKTVRDAKTENDRQYRTQRSIKRAAWSAFIAASIYALIAAYQTYISREALLSVQRAFVFFSPEIKPWYFTDKEGSTKITSWKFVIPVRNSGTTPTRNLKDHVFIESLPQAITGDFNFHDFENGEPSVANPQDTTSYVTQSVTTDDVTATKGGIKHLYIYGWATYRDVFWGTPERVTKFCYEMHAMAGDFTNTNGPFTTRATLCQPHNCTDDDCKTQNPN